MSIFKKKPQAPELKTYNFGQSPNFRGFKRYPITTYGNDQAMKNCDLLSSKDISKSMVYFKEATYDGGIYLQVYVDDMIIGAIFDSDQIESMKKEQISAIHVRFEQQEVNFETRNAAKVFAKYEN